MKSMTQLIEETRLTFHVLVATLERLHGAGDPTPAQRAVLEYLHRVGPTPVPDIARARTVSRQHIQSIVDDLQVLGLVETQDNPAHRRSRLIVLTAGGSEIIERMMAAERSALRKVAAEFDDDELDRAAATLASLRTALEEVSS